ncbi:MAG: nucleotidyl transferase AbiEii/AbiGii toxin family protein [Thermodesulfobacteriota bacterium]
MPAAFYSAKLYPFMDRVLSLIRQTDTAFYLTGGTALGRHYLHHRYSDDLDLFVNQAADFRDQVKKALEALRRGGIAFEVGTAADDFVRILARQGETPLKIDFINDVASHYGDLQEAAFYPRIDHWRNILSNKLCALSRREPKDMADILSIAGRFSFTWPEIFGEARQKDLWVEPIEISRTIQEFPVDLLASVKWVQPVDTGIFAADLKAIHRDIFHGQANSLVSPSHAKEAI